MKELLLKLTAALLSNKKSRRKILIAILSVVVGVLLLLLAPIAVLMSMGNIESPSVDIHFDEAAFLSGIAPEQQEEMADMEADGQAIAEAMAAIGLQEQTIKAQLIYMSYFEDNPLSDFTGYANMFTQADEQIIQSINGYYGLSIDYEEFLRTYTMVMNSTVNEYNDDLVKLKAIMENNFYRGAGDALMALDELDRYQFDRNIRNTEDYAEKYIRRLLPDDFDMSVLSSEYLYTVGNRILSVKGGSMTSYGALSGSGQELYSAITAQNDDDEELDEDCEEGLGAIQ